MKKIVKDCGGVIFFYVVIVGMILMMNYRFKDLNMAKTEQEVVFVADYK